MRSSSWRLRCAGVAVLASLLFLAFAPLVGQETSEAPLISSELRPSELLSSSPVDQALKANPTSARESTSGQVGKRGLSPRRALLWLWTLADKKGEKADSANDLGKAAVFAIALLAAFLTAVEVWQIPPPRRRLRRVDEPGEEDSAEAGAGSRAAGASDSSLATVPTYGTAALLFHSNFARTVLGGLAGMALVATFDGFWKNTGNEFEEEPLYLVLFVTFFLIFLSLSALFRGLTEAIRSRVSLVRRVVPGANLLRRFWTWLLSLRVPALVFFDTGFNVIQGRNQLQTASFEHDIVELHESIVNAVCRIRQRLDDAFQAALLDHEGKGWDGKQRSDTSVRVNISLMASDESSVFYVSREVGSLGKAFGRDSIAWLSLHTGLPLWHRQGPDRPSQLRIDNSNGRYEGLPKKHIAVEDYLAKRNQSDYEAFVVLPLPWGHRGEAEGYRKAGIHVSFTHKEDMDHLWPRLNQFGDSDLAACANPDLLGQEEKPQPKDRKLAATLQLSAEILTELFRYFNGMVFEEQIRPTLRPN